MTPAELIGRVPDLPSLPEVYFQVDRVLRDPDFSLQELSEVIEREPAIAARLMRLANSALYGFSGHIDTIQRAVTMIGSDEIRDLILSSAVLSAFKRMPVGARFDALVLGAQHRLRSGRQEHRRPDGGGQHATLLHLEAFTL